MEFGRKLRDYVVPGAVALLGTLGSYNDANAQSIGIKSESNRPIVGPGQQFTLELRADSRGMGVPMRGVSWVAEPSEDVQILGAYLPSTIIPSPNTDDFFYNALMSSSNRIDSTLPLTNNIRLVSNSSTGIMDREGLIGSYIFSVNPNILEGSAEPYLTRGIDLITNVAFVDIDFNEYNSPDAGSGVDVYNIPFKIARFGDANLNGVVSVGDVVLLAGHFNQSGGWEQGDFTGDDIVSIGDLTVLANHFGEGYDFTSSEVNYSSLSSSVPTPSAFISGLSALALLNTRRKGKLESRV